MRQDLFQHTGHNTQADLINEVIQLIKLLMPMRDLMSRSERSFVLNISSALDRFGHKTRITFKQLAWLRDLNERY
jgi:hypothetical protein